MKQLKIAILGSTSHIAKGLINNFLRYKKDSLHLYTMSLNKLNSFLATIEKTSYKNCVIHKGYSDFPKYSYDVIINCVGVGTWNKLQGNYSLYFTVTEEYDNLIINYLRKVRSDTFYISFSSGAVYGRKFSSAVEENTQNCIRVNHIIPEDYYSIVRINAEAKHRSFRNFKIADLRVFSYFSRFTDLTEGYFITEILNCILNKKVFVTDNQNIIRDYIHPNDLFLLVRKCISAGQINMAFDALSVKPVEKMEILEYFSSNYGLKYEIKQSLDYSSPTGVKEIYYSRYNNAASIGYKPLFSSMETIQQESKYVLGVSDP